jgi:hypothetical protein
MPKKATKQNADVVAKIDAQIQGIIAELDAQIVQLEEKKAALLTVFGGTAARRRGRPAGSAKTVEVQSTDKPAKTRVVSAATKRKLKEAAKARWARQREEKAKGGA